ncbi:hypothetical protein O6H91_22G015900 [Diphasiastrum complanatum]|uniref:Uncharacterized protein n=1 Tax=Diphasiastrum complanatum TaxID=34168 RepID=A0ACC2AD61_DIPCM|nr:hypothetical protein O6H91_22G015900 [Diphasiastrum complanatum]
MQWRRVMLEGKTTSRTRGGAIGPGKRWGHTCNAVEDGRLIYVFGGYGKYDCQTKDVHVFDAVKETWSKPVLKGTPPSPRNSHTSTTVGDRIFVFGGTDGHKPLDDFYVLDTVSNTWSKPAVRGDGPIAREGHGAALIGRDLLIFGGCGRSSSDSENYLNDLHILNTETFQWRKLATTGPSPIPRKNHASSSYKNKFIVVGGTDASNSRLGDVHMLDVDALAWTDLKTTGTKLEPRAAHMTVTIGRHLFVFGGFADKLKFFDDLHVLDLESGVWTKEETTGSGPSARRSLAGDCVNLEKGIILLHGGCNEGLEALDDMYYLNTDLRLERNPADQTPEKFSFKKELKRRRQEHLALTMLGKEKAMDSQKAIIPALLPGVFTFLFGLWRYLFAHCYYTAQQII